MKKTTFRISCDGFVDTESVLRQIEYMINGLHKAGYYDIILKEHKENRSIEQNKYYWKIIGALEEYTGYPKENLHAFFKRKFLTRYVRCFESKFIEETSTTQLSVKEMTEYIEKVTAYILTEIEPNFMLPPLEKYLKEN
ncbi:MAG: hypothetical protein HUK08_00240 [Bacteroidaceae bacterium]|nr:hypothetical protein [Bacteroidaceae bacterium]